MIDIHIEYINGRIALDDAVKLIHDLNPDITPADVSERTINSVKAEIKEEFVS